MTLPNSLFDTKNEINDELKRIDKHNPQRNIKIIDLDTLSNNKGLIAKTLFTFTNHIFEGKNEAGRYKYQTDMHIRLDMLLDNHNFPLEHTSPFTISMNYKGYYDIIKKYQTQYFNIIPLHENALFKNYTDQEIIEYCIKQHPEQNIKDDDLKIPSFTINMVQ